METSAQQSKPVIELELREGKSIPCPNCGQTSDQLMPPLQLLNTPSFSGVVIPHSGPWKCPHCHVLFTCVVGDVHYVLNFVLAVPNRQQVLVPDKKIIAPS